MEEEVISYKRWNLFLQKLYCCVKYPKFPHQFSTRALQYLLITRRNELARSHQSLGEVKFRIRQINYMINNLNCNYSKLVKMKCCCHECSHLHFEHVSLIQICISLTTIRSNLHFIELQLASFLSARLENKRSNTSYSTINF